MDPGRAFALPEEWKLKREDTNAGASSRPSGR